MFLARGRQCGSLGSSVHLNQARRPLSMLGSVRGKLAGRGSLKDSLLQFLRSALRRQDPSTAPPPLSQGVFSDVRQVNSYQVRQLFSTLPLGRFVVERPLLGSLPPLVETPQTVHTRPPSRMCKTTSVLPAQGSDPVKDYLEDLRHLLKMHSVHDKPHLVYNVDEKLFLARFFHGDGYSEVMKNLRLRIQDAAQCPNFTLLGGGSAAGERIPPLIVLPRQHLTPRVERALRAIDANVTTTETGFSNNRVFREYIMMLVKRAPDLPVVVVVDGHRSHMGKFTRDWARDNGVFLSVLPPRTSHILQPMDAGIFTHLDRTFLDRCEEFLMRRPPETIMMSWEVIDMVCHAFAEATTRNRLREAFSKTGIFHTEFVLPAK